MQPLQAGAEKTVTGGIALSGKRRKLEVSSVFNQDDEDENTDQSRKLKLSLPSEEDKRVRAISYIIVLIGIHYSKGLRFTMYNYFIKLYT